MTYFRRQIAKMWHMDWSAVNLAKSTLGLAIVLVALILLSTIGAFGFTMAFGAVLAIAFDSGGPRLQRVAGLIAFALAGALATLLGNGLGQSIWGSITVIFGVTLVCGLMLALGPQIGKMAFFINLWMMIALSLSSALYAPINLALGFFSGSALFTVVLLLMPNTYSKETTNPPLEWSIAPLRAHLKLRSPIMQFALSRAFVAAFAMWLGWQLALAHPFWIAMTLLIVLVPDRRQAAQTSWQRAIGTVIGVAIGAVVIGINFPMITLLLLWLLVTLIMLATQGVNYVLYAAILTLNLILFYKLLEADVLFNGLERLATTLLGIAFALGILLVLEYLAQRQNREPAAE